MPYCHVVSLLCNTSISGDLIGHFGFGNDVCHHCTRNVAQFRDQNVLRISRCAKFGLSQWGMQ